MSDLDRFTTDELERMHQRLADTGNILYTRGMTLIEASRQLPVWDYEAYSAICSDIEMALAAGRENHELLVSVGTELRRREASRV